MEFATLSAPPPPGYPDEIQVIDAFMPTNGQHRGSQPRETRKVTQANAKSTCGDVRLHPSVFPSSLRGEKASSSMTCDQVRERFEELRIASDIGRDRKSCLEVEDVDGIEIGFQAFLQAVNREVQKGSRSHTKGRSQRAIFS